MMDGFLSPRNGSFIIFSIFWYLEREWEAAGRYKDCGMSRPGFFVENVLNEPNGVYGQGGQHVIITCNQIHHVPNSKLALCKREP
jgi:hypothetical protein